MISNKLKINFSKMEQISNSVCRLCLNVGNGSNFKVIEETVKEVLVILLKWNVDENTKCMICISCFTRLFAAFQFREICINTENSISSYVHSRELKSVDLKEIYSKVKSNQHLKTMLKEERICRLCMEIITSVYTKVKDVEIDMIQKCVPEINLNSTLEPVICAACLDSLNTLSSFLKDCSVAAEQSKLFDNHLDNNVWIKNEGIKIKREVTDEVYYKEIDIKRKVIDEVKNEEIEVKREESDEEHAFTLSAKNEFDDGLNMYDSMENSTNLDDKNCALYPHTVLETENTKHFPTDEKTFACDVCDYKGKRKEYLARHLLKHKDLSEIQVFECNTCDYISKRKYDLQQHELIHKDFTETKAFTCDVCGYKCKRKDHFDQHTLAHKDFSETPVFECDKCDYKSKRKGALKKHQVRHKDFSEVQAFECHICSYKAKKKGNLTQHLLTHKDITQTQVFACETCDYKCKRKSNLKRHLLKHRDISEVEVFKCDLCDYRGKEKNRLTKHLLSHTDVSEMKQFECHTCGFKSKQNSDLRRHRSTQKHLSKS